MFGNINFDKSDEESKDKNPMALQNEIIDSRTIIISEEVSPELAKKVFSQLVIMNGRSEKDPIYVYINSPGGCADSGSAIQQKINGPYRPGDCATVLVQNMSREAN